MSCMRCEMQHFAGGSIRVGELGVALNRMRAPGSRFHAQLIHKAMHATHRRAYGRLGWKAADAELVYASVLSKAA
jgi:hypothetical protein